MDQWLRYVGEYKKDTIITPLSMMMEVVMDITIPLLMANMIDTGISAGDMGAVGRMGLWLVLACALSLLSGALSGRFAARASAGFGKNLRRGLFEKIQGFSFGSIDKFSTSSLVTRLTTDVTNVQNAFQMIIRLCVRAPLMILFAVAMVLRINASMAWIFLCVIPVLAAGLGLIMYKAMPVFTRVFKLYDRLNTVVQENVRGIRVVKSYVREEHEVEKFKETSGKIYADFVTAERIVAFNSPLMQFCVYACTLMVCWFGARLIVFGDFTTGQLMSLLTYTMQILMSLMMLSMVFVMLTISKASAARIGEVLREGETMANGALEHVADGSVRFEGVDFGYRGKDGELCLSGIDIQIESGQTVGIVGGTGSGKTTLTQLIPRLYDATNGRVLVGGVDVRDYDLHALREQVAMVLQKNVLFAGTIKDNLRWGDKDATDEQIRRACQLAQASEFIEAMPDGYDTWIEQGGSNVSGGQKQRLCIARALLKNPKILILDDSTSAVDTHTDALIRKAFADGIPDATKIIIAQRVSSVMDADVIIVMDDGRVSAIGAHDELMESSAIYREVYESQQKGAMGNGAA